jgi:hypothetical protein
MPSKLPLDSVNLFRKRSLNVREVAESCRERLLFGGSRLPTLLHHCPHAHESFTIHDERLEGERAFGISVWMTNALGDHAADRESVCAIRLYHPETCGPHDVPRFERIGAK